VVPTPGGAAAEDGAEALEEPEPEPEAEAVARGAVTAIVADTLGSGLTFVPLPVTVN
jgi:hypothetical protein